ncbi:MAG TPA: glycosyltransferase family 4 protein [Sphingobium sp.]
MNRGSTQDAGAGRVTFVLPALGAGGSEHVVSMLANRLTQTGLPVSIITFEAPDTPSYYPLVPGVLLHQLGLPPGSSDGMGRYFDSVSRIRRLNAAFRRDRPALVISFLTRTNVLSVLAATGLDIPVIVSERNNPELQDPGSVWNLLRRLTYPRAHGLITMTRGALDHFPPSMRRRGWVIPNMADWHIMRTVHDGGPKVFTAVGRLVAQKGFDMLIDAFASVAGGHPDWILRIWGEGPDRAALERQIALRGMTARIQLPGVSDSPGSWIGSADAFVLSSRFEGWGLVLGEAMAAGLPAVSFNCHWGPEEMIDQGENGLLVPPDDVAALAAAMARLMGDADLRTRLGEAATLSMQRFRPERILDKWRTIIGDVLDTADIQQEVGYGHVCQ